jgi:diaminopimelate decarboxylase
MNPFSYRDGILHAEAVPLPQIAADHGTPCYVYSRTVLQSRFDEFRRALAGRDALVCYAVKANSNLAILNLFARAGAGFDIVSGGELARVLAAGGDPAKWCFPASARRPTKCARRWRPASCASTSNRPPSWKGSTQVAGSLGRRAPVSLRVNPDVDPKTHPYIATGLKSAKFGIPSRRRCRSTAGPRALPHIDVHGIDCHIGSQLLDPAPAAEAAAKVLGLVDAAGRRRHRTVAHRPRRRHGHPLPRRSRRQASPSTWRRCWRRARQPQGKAAVRAGALAGRQRRCPAHARRVPEARRGEELRHRRRRHERPHAAGALRRLARHPAGRPAAGAAAEYEIVGPVCESGDFLGHAARLAVAPGDLLAVMSAGAYGMAMSSNYNTRPRAAEVIVDGSRVHLVRERERVGQLFAGERVLL